MQDKNNSAIILINKLTVYVIGFSFYKHVICCVTLISHFTVSPRTGKPNE